MMEINTTPLIDVMLVLLVMLIITIPVQLHAINLALPVGRAPANAVTPEKIQIDIDDQSVVHWQGDPIAISQIEAHMVELAHHPVQPEIHVRADKNAKYAVFADVLAASRRNGLDHVALIGSEQFEQ